MSISSLQVRLKPKYKLILLGDQAVGKTCLIEQFVNHKFQQSEEPTVGIDFVVTNVHHNNRQYRLQLWDTAGQERFKSLIPGYLRDSQCAIIMYDVGNKESLNGVDKWLEMYRQHVEESSFVVVVGNKIDLKYRFAGEEEMRKIREKYKSKGIQLFEVSAKNGNNVQQLFHRIIEIIEENNNKPILTGNFLETLQEQQQKNSGSDSSPKRTVRLKANSLKQIKDSQKNEKGKCC